MVIFSPEDLSLIKDGPRERRRFIDLELCQLNKIYLYNLTRYNRVLLQRNKLLKDISFKPQLEDSLSVWDEELVKYGQALIRLRREFIESLQEKLIRIHKNISGGREELILSYEENVKEEAFLESVLRARETEKNKKSVW
ncbi:DNA replication and repair protein RecF domain protein [Oribacterium sp. oral taxon 108 str. F0425]|nr:DNA replication and repair protein RecF [Oribacterium sp. oral taxon 108]EGL37511.1 DNA replication and repair protein RecF domain protein [Oribacterium sp. oral taxon 108 str. F0425]